MVQNVMRSVGFGRTVSCLTKLYVKAVCSFAFVPTSATQNAKYWSYSVFQKYKGNVKFGKVNCDMLPSVCNMNGVNAYPTIYFYPPQSPGEKRPRRKLVTAQNPDVIVRNLEGFMKQYPDMQTQTKEKLKVSVTVLVHTYHVLAAACRNCKM